jgi:2-aminoethylphosphonate-pyruvate transaminase
MSSFGAVPLDIEAAGVDYLVSSANKCIEGVPGFAFTVARRSSLIATKGQARSVSHDLFAQWDGLETDGQFRFTPPTHALLAFDQALTELADEGGVPGRAARYAANHRALVEGMRGLSFREYLPPEKQSHIITSFHYPTHAGFSFEDFYERLSDRGFVIYPGKLSKVDCFRIGTIGRIFEADVRRLIDAIGETLADMGCPNGA